MSRAEGGRDALEESALQCFISAGFGSPSSQLWASEHFPSWPCFLPPGVKRTFAPFSFLFHYFLMVTESEAISHLQIAHSTRKLGQRSLSRPWSSSSYPLGSGWSVCGGRRCEVAGRRSSGGHCELWSWAYPRRGSPQHQDNLRLPLPTICHPLPSVILSSDQPQGNGKVNTVVTNLVVFNKNVCDCVPFPWCHSKHRPT